MRVFLTGGTGFIGRPLVRGLLARGWSVTALARRPEAPAARLLARLGATVVPGDVTRRDSMEAAMEGADLVVHNAGWYELGVVGDDRRRMHEVNVTGTANVLGLALDLGVPRAVHVSSVAVWGESGDEERDESFTRTGPCHSRYEETKVEAHQVALAHHRAGLAVSLACPHQVIGANDHSAYGYFVRLFANGWLPPVMWGAHAVAGPVHVDDAAEGIALVAEKGRPGRSYILAGESLSRREIVAIWDTQPGGLKRRIWLPRWAAWPLFALAEPLERVLGLPAFLSREIAGSAVSNHFSSARAREELGWRCRSARDLWVGVLAEERRLAAHRAGRGIVARMRPLPVADEVVAQGLEPRTSGM